VSDASLLNNRFTPPQYLFITHFVMYTTTSHTHKLIGWSDPAAPTVVAPPPPQEEEEQPKRRKTHAGNERRSSVEDAKARAALAKKDTKTSEESKVQS
jgi:hypothetical protein